MEGAGMKDKIIVFLALVALILVFVIYLMYYQKKALETEKNALYDDVCRYKQSLVEMEKQNEVLLEAKKENEKFKQNLANDDSENLNVVPASYILNRMRQD